eukprot:gene13182-biopygen15560
MSPQRAARSAARRISACGRRGGPDGAAPRARIGLPNPPPVVTGAVLGALLRAPGPPQRAAPRTRGDDAAWPPQLPAWRPSGPASSSRARSGVREPRLTRAPCTRAPRGGHGAAR